MRARLITTRATNPEELKDPLKDLGNNRFAKASKMAYRRARIIPPVQAHSTNFGTTMNAVLDVT